MDENRRPPLTKPPKKDNSRPTSSGALTAARIVALGSSALAGAALGLGIYPEVIAAPGSFNWVLPFIIPPVLAGGLAVGWHYSMGIAAHADDTPKRVAAFALGAFLFAVGTGTSSWFLASKIGGASAIQQYQLDYVEQLQRAEDAVYANAAVEDELVAALGSGSNGMLSLAQSEGLGGIISGAAGFKRVYSILQNAAGAFGGAQSMIGDQAAERQTLLALAGRERVEAMRAVAARNAPEFEDAVARAATAISKADKIRLSSSVSGLGIGLVMDEARPQIETAIGKVRDLALNVDAKRKAVTVPPYFPIDAKEAVTRFPPALAWIAAVMIELVPLMMLVALLVLWRKSEDEAEEVEGQIVEFEPRRVPVRHLPPAAE